MPVVTTLHTVLREPNIDQRTVMAEIATLSDRLIVMSQQSADILEEVFHVSPDKIDLIPHGIPDLPFTDSSFFKDGFGTEGKEVLLTFGLLRSEEHTSELQSQFHLVCRLLLEKKKLTQTTYCILQLSESHI